VKPLLSGILAVVFGFLALYHGTNSGISRGQLACLTKVQHSTNSSLVDSVEKSVEERLVFSVVFLALSLLFAITCGSFLGEKTTKNLGVAEREDTSQWSG